MGACYADYVAGGSTLVATELEQAEDSLSREVDVHDDAADDLIKGVLHGDEEALALWYRTRACVIAGQRKTLSRLGVAFDRVLFESDFLHETADLVEAGLRCEALRRREDGVVVCDTGVQGLEELPLVRSDGLSTQHLRSLTYALSAPELDGMTSLQVTGSEWVAHLTSIRKLATELQPDLNGGFHPNCSIFHGMVSQQKCALTSSACALLVDELADWIDREIEANSTLREELSAHPHRERIAAQIGLGYFLPHPVAPDLDFEPGRLMSNSNSLGLSLVRARARHSSSPDAGRPAAQTSYRFAVVQSEPYRRYLRLAVEKLDVWPLAHYVRHLALWQLEADHGEPVDRVGHTLLDRGARGLGLEPTR